MKEFTFEYTMEIENEDIEMAKEDFFNIFPKKLLDFGELRIYGED